MNRCSIVTWKIRAMVIERDPVGWKDSPEATPEIGDRTASLTAFGIRGRSDAVAGNDEEDRYSRPHSLKYTAYPRPRWLTLTSQIQAGVERNHHQASHAAPNIKALVAWAVRKAFGSCSRFSGEGNGGHFQGNGNTKRLVSAGKRSHPKSTPA
jgi:hypothetical protein